MYPDSVTISAEREPSRIGGKEMGAAKPKTDWTCFLELVEKIHVQHCG
jgi:hypothetical protein